MSSLNYNYFLIEFQKNNANINELYEQIMVAGPEVFSSFAEYAQIIQFLVTKYVQYNDYLHSNNLLQIFRIHCNSKLLIVNDYDWFLYYSLKIYSKRSIKYYLEKPFVFWEIVYSLAEYVKSDYVERLDSLLIDTLEYYKKEYVVDPEFLSTAMTNFVNYYLKNKPYTEIVTLHINELKKLIASDNISEVLEIYNNLETQAIYNEKIKSTETVDENDIVESDKLIEKKYYSDICLDDNCRNKKIMIIGSDPFVHNKNIIFGIAKDYNIQKNQLEIYDDYDRIKQEGERIISKTQYNVDKYIGIIFGSNPHSTSGNEGASSLITKITSEPGFPYVAICRGDGKNGKLKITKSNLRKAFKDIVLNYKVNR